MRKVCVIGLGYIGLPTASMLASSGYEVLGVDINKRVIEELNSGRPTIDEPEVKQVVIAALKSGRLRAKTEPEEADVFIICVPTPLEKGKKRAGLDYVRGATESVAKVLKKGNLVVLESTVPPGTLEEVLLPILERKVRRDEFYLVHCPERVIPGSIVKELVWNNRIIGGMNKESAEKAESLYRSFVKGNINLTDAKTAAMVKLMENTFRDVNIALANEFAKICESMGINAREAIDLANKHPRVRILAPGPGVGGHCISVDPWFIYEKAPEEAKLIKAAREVNDSMPAFVAGIVKKELTGVKNPKVTILGVSYKGNVDDTRESPAIGIIWLLKKSGFNVSVYDPRAKEFEFELSQLKDAVKGSDCLVLVADHSEFRELDIDDIGKLMRGKLLIDTRKYLDHNRWASNGFKVRVLGDPKGNKR